MSYCLGFRSPKRSNIDRIAFCFWWFGNVPGSIHWFVFNNKSANINPTRNIIFICNFYRSFGNASPPQHSCLSPPKPDRKAFSNSMFVATPLYCVSIGPDVRTGRTHSGNGWESLRNPTNKRSRKLRNGWAKCHGKWCRIRRSSGLRWMLGAEADDVWSYKSRHNKI